MSMSGVGFHNVVWDGCVVESLARSRGGCCI